MALDSTYNQFAFENLLKGPGEVFQQPDLPELPKFESPVSGFGNIDFPVGYNTSKQAESPIAASVQNLFNSGATERFMGSPVKFNNDQINAARYMSSPDYFKLGISLSGDNEERYGQNQSWSEVLSNAKSGMFKLAANGFIDGWKGWGRMTDGVIHLDWAKFIGNDPESLLELDRITKEAMELNPIYATKEGTETFWNRQTFGNMLQQGGFTLGALAQMGLEMAITKVVEAGLVATGAGIPIAGSLEVAEGTRLAAGIGRITSMFKKSKEFFDAAKNFKALKKMGDVWKSEKLLNNFVRSVGKKLPIVDVGIEMSDAYRLGKATNLAGTKLASDLTRIGIGGLKRTLSEANFAFSEARMEAAGTFSDLYSQMQDQHYKDFGYYATGDGLQKMQDRAMEAAGKNFNFNTAILLISNRIQFDNLFKGSKVMSKILSKFGDDVAEGAQKVLKVSGKVNGRKTTQYYTDGLLSNYKNIAKTFGKGKALEVTATSLVKPLLKFEAVEGIQELFQEGSNEYYKDLYLNLYRASYNPEVIADSSESLDKAIESQNSMQGLKTFASGALTGMMIHGPVNLLTSAAGKINTRIQDEYATKGLTPEQKKEVIAERKSKREAYKKHYAEFNAIAKDPTKFFSESVKNLNLQKEGSAALDEAAKAGDKFAYENIRTDAFHSMVSQAYRNNTHEALIDTLREYGKHMTKEEFEQAFVSLEYTSDTKKSAADYVNKVADSVESYIKTRNRLEEQYGKYANPNRYEYGSKEFINESIKKKVLNDMLDILAGNEFKATDALKRSTSIFEKLSDNKAMGASLATAYNILNSKKNLDNEISVLNQEIKTKKDLLANVTDAKQKSDLLAEIKIKEEQIQHLTDWSATTNWEEKEDALIRMSDVDRSYQAFKNYLDSKNRQNGRFDNVIKDEDVINAYSNLIDYIKLNKKAEDHVAAINMLSNPTYFEEIHKRMEKGAKLAFLQMAHDAAAEYIKEKGSVPNDEHFILQVSGLYGIFNPAGVLISSAETLEDAREIKKQVDEAVFGKKEKAKKEKTDDEDEEEDDEFVVDDEMPTSDELEKEKEKGDYDILINGEKKLAENKRNGITPKEPDPAIKAMIFKIAEYPNFTKAVKEIIKRRDAEILANPENEDDIVKKYDEILEELKQGNLPEFLRTEKSTEKKSKKEKVEMFSVGDVLSINGEVITVKEVRENDAMIEYDFNLNSDLENTDITKEELAETVDTFIYDKKTKKYFDSNGVEIDVKLSEETDVDEVDDEEEIVEEETNFAFFEFPQTDVDDLDSSVKPKLKGNQKIIGTGKAGLFVVKTGNTYAIVDRYGVFEKNEKNLSFSYITEEDAFEKLDELSKKRIENYKNKNDFFDFTGKRIKYGQILKDNSGKYFVVLSYGKPDSKNRINLQRVFLKDGKFQLYKTQYSKNLTESDISNYNYVYKKSATEKKESVFKIKDDAFFQKARVHREKIDDENWQTDTQAQEQLDELLRNATPKDLEKNLRIEIVRIPKANRKKGRVAGGKYMPNEFLTEDAAEIYSARIFYGDKIIGYIPTENYFVIKNKAGKTVAPDEMDDATFKSIFDVTDRDAKQMKQNFIASYKLAKSLFYKISKDLGKEYEITYSGKEALDLFGVYISPGEYSYYTGEKKSQRTPFNNLKHNTIDGAFVILDTATRKGSATKSFSISAQNADRSFLSSSKLDDIKKQIDNEISKNPELIKNLGRYVAVIKLPNGNIRFVELTTRQMSDASLSKIVENINEQSKKTKETNLKKETEQVVEKGKTVTKVITVGADKTFNTDFNDELSSKLFVRVLKQTGFTIELELSPVGNLNIKVSKLSKDGKTTIRRTAYVTSEKPLSFENTDIFIESLNKAILEHDSKIPDDRASERINIELTKESFKESLPDTSKLQDFLDADMLAPVTADVVKNLKIGFKPNVEIVEDLTTEKDTEDAPKKNVTKKTTRKKKVDLTVEEDSEEESSDLETDVKNKETKTTKKLSIEKLKEILDFDTYSSKYGARNFLENPRKYLLLDIEYYKDAKYDQGSESHKRTYQGALNDLAKYDAEIEALEEKEKSFSKQKDVVEKKKTGAASEEYAKLVAEKESFINSRTLELFQSTGSRLKSKVQAEKEASEKYDARIQALVDAVKKDALKVVEKDNFTETSAEDITEFKKWISKNFPDFVSVEEMDMLETNMKKGMVTVGMFTAYMKILQDGRKTVAGKIRVGAKTPFKYHEAFHAVFRLMLSEEKIEKYLNLAREEELARLKGDKVKYKELINEFRNIHPIYSSLSEKELEERYLEEKIADRFEEWKTNKQVKTHWSFKTFFAKLFDFIKNLFKRKNKNELDALFNQINTGKFKNAKLQDNRFTKEDALSFTEPAFKIIKIGEEVVNDENKNSFVIERYLSQSKSDKLSSTIASIFHRRSKEVLSDNDNTYNKNLILDQILDDYKNLYDFENTRVDYYENLFNSYSEVEFEEKYKELKQYREIFSNPENRQILKEAVDVHLNVMGYKMDLESEEFEELVDDYGDRVTTDSWKETHSIGGFGSLSQELRQYIANTVVEYVDEFGNVNLVEGEPLIQAVDANLVYNGVLKAISNISDQNKIVKRLSLLASDETETGIFVTKFINDVGLIIDESDNFDISNKRNADMFQKVIKGFQQYNVDYIFINKDIRNDKKISRIFYANRKDSSKTQFTQWQNAYVNVYEKVLRQAQTKEEKLKIADRAASVWDAFNNLVNTSVPIPDEQLKEEARFISNNLKNTIGISITPLLIEFSIIAQMDEENRSIEQKKLYDSYQDASFITSEQIKEIARTIRSLENPFAKNVELKENSDLLSAEDDDVPEELEEKTLGEGGAIKRINDIAKANSLFDETVYTTSFKNSEGELVYSHQLPTYHLTKVVDLNDQELRDALMNDPFLSSNYLLNSPEFSELVKQLKVERVDGLKSSYLTETAEGDILENKTLEVNQLEGVTYGKFGSREFAAAMLDLYSFNKQKRTEEGVKFYTSNHLIRVIEASNTGDTVALPVIKTVKRNKKGDIVLQEKAELILINEIKNELERIKRVRKEIKDYQEFGIIPASGLIEGYHYKPAEDKETKELVRDFRKGRGLFFYKTSNLLGSELSSKILAMLDENEDLKIEDVKLESEIKIAINEYFNNQLNEYFKQLIDLKIISKNEDGEYSNNLIDGFIEKGFTKKQDGEDISDDEKNQALNIKLNDIEHNIWQIFINDYINTLSFNQLLLGDEALSFKDAVDQVKRAKGANGSGPNAESTITSDEFGIKHEFKKCHITVMDDPKFIKKFGKNAGKTGDLADAQMWMTAKGARYMKFGLGRLTLQQAQALDKIERGEKLTKEEIFGSNGLIKSNGMFNSEKLVYFDGQIYIKTSAVILTKELTSRYDAVSGRWVAKIGREDLHKMREEMEAFEKANNTVSIVVPSSASKGLKRNVIKNVNEFSHRDSDQFTEQQTKYWRLQVENPSNKLVITDPTQAKQLITAEQDDNLDVYFSWTDDGRISKTAVPIKMKQIKEMYYSDTDQRIKNNYENARNQIFNIENAISELSASKALGKITPSLAKFQKNAIETLKSSGGDAQLIEFFAVDENDEPVYNLNNPLTLDKYTQLFLAYFSKGVMSEKVPGTPIALMSNYGIKVVKRFTGKYTESGEPIGEVIKSDVVDKNPSEYANAKRMKDDLTRTFDDLKEGDYYVDDLRHNVPEFDKDGNITGYYTEFMLPPHFKELMDLLPEDAIPEIIAKAFGVRIPTQDKHSFVNLKMVDYLPAFMGSTGIFAHELVEISGADFDIDKLYVAIHEFYMKGNKFVGYGSATTNDGKYEEYLNWNLKNNKDFKKYFKSLKQEDAAYNNAASRLKSIKILRNALKKLIYNIPVGTVQLSNEYRTAVNANRLINNLVNTLDNTAFTASDEEFDFVQNSFEDLLNNIEKWEIRDFAIGIAESTLKELKSLARDSKDELNKLEDAETRLLRMALLEFNMPTSTREFIEKSASRELNNGVLNNRILDAKIAMFGNRATVTGKNPTAFEPATVDDLQELVEVFTEAFADQSDPDKNVEYMRNILIESNIDVDNLLGKLKAFTNNKEGSRNIGSAVNAMLGYNVLNTFQIDLRKSKVIGENETEPFSILNFNNQDFDTYKYTKSYNPQTKQFDGPRIAGVISTLVSAMTDNAKERLAAKLGLNIEALGYVSNMVALGVPLKSAVMYMLQPIVLEYFKTVKANSSKLKTSDEKTQGKRNTLKNLLESLESDLEDGFKKINLNDDLLTKNIKEVGADAGLQYSILMDFSIIVEQTEYFNKISQVLKLTKGLGTSWENKDKIDKNITDLGLKMSKEEFEKSSIPIDLRQVFLGADPKKPYHKFMKTYINISDQLEYLSKTVFIEKTDIFKTITDLVYSNFNVTKKQFENFSVAMKRDIISYLCIKAYMKKLKDQGNFASLNSLDNALIYDVLAEKKDPSTFADIVKIMNKIREELPDNYLAHNFLNVLKTYKTDVDGNVDINEYNKDGINKVEANTWAKLSEYQQEKLLDSFIEIYQNDTLRESGLATALFHYLLVKDGGQFKSGSYIKFVPNFMFKTLMDASKLANDVLQKEYTSSVKEEYKSIFGLTKEELLNDFLNIYTSSVGNEMFIKMLLKKKMNDVKIDAATIEEKREIEEALKEHDETQALKYSQDKSKVYINIFAGIREFMIPVERNGRIQFVKNPKLKDKFTSLERAKRNKNIQYLLSKGFEIEYGIDGKMSLLFPTEFKTKLEGEKSETFYRLTSVDKQKSDKEYSFIDNPLDLIDIENGDFIAKGIKAVYTRSEKRGSKKQTKLAHMFGKPPVKGQLPTVVNKDSLGFVGFSPEYDQREEYAEIIDVNQEAKEIRTKTVGIPISEIQKKLNAVGISFTFKNKKYVFEGDLWDVLPEDVKKKIKNPSDLLKLIGDDSIVLYDEDAEETSSKKVVKKTVRKTGKKVTIFEQADNLPYIEQNYNTDPKDYKRGNYKKGEQWKQRDVTSEVKTKLKGKKIISSMDMIKAGLRTRTTRTENWLNKLMDNLGIENPKNLVGVILKQVDQHTGEYVYTRITSVNEFTKKYQDETWELEGWVKSVTDILLYQKNTDGEQRYKWGIEFEVVKPDYGSYKGVEKVISGMQTGVDTQVGLDVATELDLKTGGTAPKNFKTQEGSRPQLAKKLNVKEPDDRYVYLVEKLKSNWSTIATDNMSDTNWYDEYYARNVYNILDSDATVIFAKDLSSTGTQATILMLKYFKKKYIVNPTAKDLSEFLEKNEVRTLNVAGNRMTKLGKSEAEQSKIINGFKKTFKSALESLNSNYESEVVTYYEEEDDVVYNEEDVIEEDEEQEEDDDEIVPVKKETPKKEKSKFEMLLEQQEELTKKAGLSSLPWNDVDDIDKFIEEQNKCNKPK